MDVSVGGGGLGRVPESRAERHTRPERHTGAAPIPGGGATTEAVGDKPKKPRGGKGKGGAKDNRPADSPPRVRTVRPRLRSPRRGGVRVEAGKAADAGNVVEVEASQSRGNGSEGKQAIPAPKGGAAPFP